MAPTANAFPGFWQYCFQRPEIQKTIMQEQSEDTPPQMDIVWVSCAKLEHPYSAIAKEKMLMNESSLMFFLL